MDSNGPYKTWGKSRSSRLAHHDYSTDRPIHLTICTEGKRDLFGSRDDADIVITQLLNSVKELRFRLICYCLMPDHLHIVISPGPSGTSLSKFLNTFKGRTTALFRKREGRERIWQHSAYDHIIRAEENLKSIIEYILGNPVRRGLVENAEDYPYSKWFQDEVVKYI